MPICQTCDGDSFRDENGKFYCNTCGLESMEIQVVVNQELEFDAYSASQYLKLSKKKERTSKALDVGKPWVLHEGIQCLLKAQVEALIKMGFNEKLKDVVGQFWFFYLRTKKVAFCDDEPSVFSINSKTQTCRHQNVGLLPPSIKRQRVSAVQEDAPDQQSTQSEGIDVANVKSEENVKAKELHDDEEFVFSQRIDKELERMDGYIKREVESERDSDIGSDEEEDKLSKVGSVGSVKLNDGKRERLLSQKETLCFCYLGLVWLEEPVLISDLVRWAREGVLPYHQATKVLPPQMKFAFYDSKLMNTKTSPDIQNVFLICARMVKRLKIDVKFTKEMCKIVATAAIFDLQFTKSVSVLTNHVIDLTNFSLNFNNKLNSRTSRKCKASSSLAKELSIDGYIAAFVMISVKLLYYLDDRREFNGCSRKNLLQKLKLPLMDESWPEWVTKHMKKRKRKLYNGIPTSQKDLQYIEDLSVYADYCTKDVFNSFDHRHATRCYNRGVSKAELSFDSKAKANYHATFLAIAEEMNNRPSADFTDIHRESTSFPISISHLGEDISLVKKNELPIEVPKTSVSPGDNDTYIVYTDCQSTASWHSSYTYFMEILSERFDLPTLRIQTCVNDLENILFEEKFE